MLLSARVELDHVSSHALHVILCPILLCYLQMIFTSNKSGKAQHFTREYDKKVNLLALICLTGLPEQATPPQLQAAWPQLMAGVMRLLIGLKEQQVQQT